MRTIRSRMLEQQRPDLPGEAARRVRERELRAQAHEETLAKFGAFTAENAAEAIAHQEARTRVLLAEVRHG